MVKVSAQLLAQGDALTLSKRDRLTNTHLKGALICWHPFVPIGAALHQEQTFKRASTRYDEHAENCHTALKLI